ncbi:flagellar basal body rod protein [Sporolactobacillus shoreae]|uniref:Flagellar basal body rod protein n=1 Tax=Sporolactobacillus shoreae TaxID=1465501 RepID=A0A4Z0GJK3_9BACL|nr:flagellar basal body rod protein [Sporolactobacillus shoreae]TGA96477.1 flagellar basal body rod protein [Sporolactobacillus shoreae]
MKKFLLIVAGAICLIVLLSHIGFMIGLLVSLAILWFAFRRFFRSDSAGGKVLWAIIGVIAIGFSLGNLPAIIGIVALVALYYVYKAWNSRKTAKPDPEDPFDNFDKQWKEMM